MSKAGIQSQNGKAFEYACINALYNKYQNKQDVRIVPSEAYDTAKLDFDKSAELQNSLNSAAFAAIRVIERLEPRLANPTSTGPLFLSLQTDSKGQAGDVRDVLCVRKDNDWEIGFSCKHNHDALKHSRLSSTIDFGDDWFGYPCSQEYFDAVRPIFKWLAQLRADGRERNKPVKWSDLEQKDDIVYVPVLQAFLSELQRLADEHSDVAAKLVEYLIGRNDFYKVITVDKDNLVKVEAWNMSDTLGKPSGNIAPLTRIPVLKLPTKFYSLEFKPESKNTVIVACDNGWQISMRIHSASTEVEPSLKFDVKLISSPAGGFVQTEPWLQCD